MDGISAGYVTANDKPYVVNSRNFNVPVCVFDRLCHHAQITYATLALFGPKMILPDAKNLWESVGAFVHGPVYFDFALEIACPDGYPIFHSRFCKKKRATPPGLPGCSTRLAVGNHDADFGTVRYQMPESPHFITFYPKQTQRI